jgi:hypothetical protein
VLFYYQPEELCDFLRQRGFGSPRIFGGFDDSAFIPGTSTQMVVLAVRA